MMRYDPNEKTIIIPERRVACITNTVTLDNEEFFVVNTSFPGGREWFTINLVRGHSLKTGQVVRCGGRFSVSVVRFSNFMDNPPCDRDPFVATSAITGARLPHEEPLRDISGGNYKVKIRNDGRLAVLTKV